MMRLTDDGAQQAQFDYQLAVEARLEPLAHQQLFGVETLRQQLYEAVVAPDKPWLISIEGLGGIGKTSLADQLIRELIPTSPFFDIAWVSARQERFTPAIGIQPVNDTPEHPALTVETLVDLLLTQLNHNHQVGLSAQQKLTGLNRLLKQQPCIIVVDNLETAADYQALIPLLRQLANPSKFLLTSRHSLKSYADTFCLNITELSQSDTIDFLTHEAQSRRLEGLAQESSEQFAEVYQVVGGNPLALKLVLGQIHTLPLNQVLRNLEQAQGRKTTDLYTYIYWQSWQALSDAGRQALLTLAVASPRGSTIEHLLAISGLQAGALSQALDMLATFSLVDVGGDLNARRYSIHRLTETFLLTEVTQWPLSP
ncbi:MAG: NB-ARC domain-containing protein [Chloroflexota bacterium]